MAKSLAKVPSADSVDTAPTHIRELVRDPANRRQHTPRNLGMVVDASQQVEAARSVVIDEHNVILAENDVTEAAAEAGITRLRGSFPDDYEMTGSYAQQWARLRNSVPPLMAYAIGPAVRDVLVRCQAAA